MTWRRADCCRKENTEIRRRQGLRQKRKQRDEERDRCEAKTDEGEGLHYSEEQQRHPNPTQKMTQRLETERRSGNREDAAEDTPHCRTRVC